MSIETNNGALFNLGIDDSIGKSPPPCVLTIFGATGDLTAKKLIPALYHLAKEGLLSPNFICVGFARKEKSDELFRQEMLDAVQKYARTGPVDALVWQKFSEQLFYHSAPFDAEIGYQTLLERLQQFDVKYGTKGNRMYYLSTPPSYFSLIIDKLKKNRLLYQEVGPKQPFSRIIIEKPFGRDLSSASLLQTNINQSITEEQTFRIDHYLGKETVQNLMLFRFGNPIFESMWNNRYIDHIQISVAEDFGIGSRGQFFEEAGILRDIIQNHMMQLLSLVSMEPPVNLDANSIRDEKVKVLQSVRPISRDMVHQFAVRGQYGAGFINDEAVCGYREEKQVCKTSNIDTYAAVELYIDNWRWSQVPFYLRSGKRLPKRATEISVFFKEAPALLFNASGNFEPNVLIIRIQPDEGISLKINTKIPGNVAAAQPVKMDFRYGSYFGSTPPEAYERLLCDAMIGDSTLFAREDEVMASWKIIEPIIDVWDNTPPIDPFPNYASGSWGPQEADILLNRSGRSWRLM